MRRLYILASVLLCGVIGAASLHTLPALASINNQISFQGKLTNPDGTNVTDGTYSIRFRIYTDPTADTGACANTCKWEETQGSVSVASGLFQVNLGSSTSLPGSVDFNASALYLGVKVGSDAEMTPRIRLAAVPQAFNSDTLDGLDSSAFVQLSGGNVTIGSGTITSGAVNGITIGSTIQPTAGGSLIIQSNGANALTLTSGAAATWSTTAGLLTVQGFGGLGLNTPATNAGSTPSTNISLTTGNASGSTSNSGNITIDVGTATGSLGTITLGHAGVATTNAGSLTVTQALTANGGITIAANQNMTMSSGTGVFAQTYAAGTNSSAHTLSVTNSNSGGSPIAVTGQDITLVGTATSGGTNTNSALKFENPSAATNNVFYGLNFAGTGYTDILRVGSNQIINGSGALQSAGLSGTYSNALTLSSASNVFTGTAYNGLTLASQSDGFTVAGGTTSRTLTVTAANITVGGTIQPTSAGALAVQSNGANPLTLTSGAAATWSTSAGLLTVQGTGGVTINSPNVSGASGAITIQSGNSSSGTAANVTIDTGTTSTGTPTVNVGNTNAIALQIGNNTSNPAITIDSGTGTIAIGTGAQARTVNVATGGATQTTTVGSTSGASSLLLQSGSGNLALTTQGTGQLNIGNNAVAQTINIGNSTGATAVTINCGTGSSCNLGTNAIAHTTTVGSITGAASTIIQSGSGNVILTAPSGSEVQIGSATTDTTQVLFAVDSFDTFADTATCGTTTNQGGLYYNTKSNAIRGCVNGAWEDMVSTAALGLQLFGVVPDSGSNPGDLAAVTGAQNGPCKVSVGANTTTVSWTACTAFSQGRKVIVAAGTAATTNGVANNFQHVCLTGANGQPALSTTGGETANLATVSLPSVTSPILCLADIKFTGANNTITQVYDTRTYTTTTKTTVSLNSAIGLGTIVVFTATKGVVVSTTTANTNKIAGVIVATTGSASSSAINAIMAIGGPGAVKAVTGTNVVADYLFTSATAGYASTVATKPTEGTGTIYNVLGTSLTAWSGASACSANNDTCAGSILTLIDKR